MPESEASQIAGRTVYGETFKTLPSWAALADIRDFAYAEPGDTSSRDRGAAIFASDPIELARRVGRYEVYQRIRHYTDVTEEQINQGREHLLSKLELAEAEEEE